MINILDLSAEIDYINFTFNEEVLESLCVEFLNTDQINNLLFNESDTDFQPQHLNTIIKIKEILPVTETNAQPIQLFTPINSQKNFNKIDKTYSPLNDNVEMEIILFMESGTDKLKHFTETTKTQEILPDI